jgi:hypothetical protein
MALSRRTVVHGRHHGNVGLGCLSRLVIYNQMKRFSKPVSNQQNVRNLHKNGGTSNDKCEITEF